MRKLLAALATAVLGALAAQAARADGLIVVPPVVVVSEGIERRPVRNEPLYVRSHRVTVEVTGRVAVTDVDQVFVNPNPRVLEGTYLFPLPEGAAIDRFAMWVDGKETSAELLDAAKARDIYESIVRQTRDPALLEYADRGLFRARVFPIDANGEKRVRIRYAELLTADAGTVAYRYPLATERFSSRPLAECSIAVTIEDDAPIASIWSPSHKVDVPAAAAAASRRTRVGWEARNVLPDRDFLLYWRPTRKPVAVAALAHRDADDPEGTFLLVVSPAARDDAPLAKDVVFVLDTSGSMAGPKMDQARAALRFCVRSLGAEDRFSIVPFATEPRPFADALVPADAERRAAAERFVDALEARGGTAIDDALRAALRLLPAASADGRPAFVVFLTDGQPTVGETDASVIAKRALAEARGARIFSFGVGSDVNTRLLDGLAEETRGTRDYVAETESIEVKVSNLWTKIARPAMTDVEVRVDGVATSAIHPKRLPDLFHGSELLVTGRFAAPGNAVVRLTGRVRGKPVEVVEELRLPERDARHAFLPRLWAVRRVGFLLDEIRLRGESAELRDEVVRLAKRFGIVTPYTSYLIVEDTARAGGGLPTAGGHRADAPDPFAPPRAPGAAAAPAPPPLADDAVESLRRAAEKGRDGASKSAGDGAVGLSLETRSLRDYEGRDDDATHAASGVLRHLHGRTFVRRADAWWETSAGDGRARRTVTEFSDAYFALLRSRPELARYLALGRVVLVAGDEVVEVVPAAEELPPPR